MGNLTLNDISISNIDLKEDLPLLYNLKKQLIKTKPQVCIERARNVTEYLKDMSSDKDPRELRFARAVNHFLTQKEAIFYDDNLLAGTTTSKPFGAPVYPEFGTGLTIWPELDTISNRASNPLTLTEEEANELNFDIYPYWLDRSILEYTKKKYGPIEGVKLFERIVFFLAGKAGCISHTVPNYKVAINKGLEFIINEAKEKESALKEKSNLTEEEQRSVLFYGAVQIAMTGIINYATKLSEKAAQLAETEADQTKKGNFNKIAAICAHIPRKPARTFREALQTIWILQIAIHGENINMAMSPGRLDQILYSFYKNDIESGTLTDKEAMELIGCFWIKLNDNTNLVPETSEKLFGGAGTVPAVTVGGVDENGKDAVNDLTYLMLRVTELLKVRDPNVNARYHYKENTKDYRNRVAEVIANTEAIPAMHNDVADIETLVNQGETLEHARDYAIIGCVELASAGKSYDASSSIIFNIVSALELALYNGKRPKTGDEQIGPKTGDPADFKSFDEFWNALNEQLTWILSNAIDLNEKFGHVYQEIQPSPLLSALFEGPMEKGQDLIFGGALYNSSGATHVGFGDTIDSLNAIEQAVFLDKKCTFGELIDALKNDFADHETLHSYLVNKTSKYGSEDDISTNNSQKLVSFLYDYYQSHTNYRGGKYRPAYWTMTNHAGQGMMAGALPNGRRDSRTFTSGITPVSQESPSLTSALNSVAKLGHLNIPGGVALNLKYPVIEKEDIPTFGDLVDGYFESGGMQVQFNILSYKTLLEAVKSEQPDLLVRVSGYSAYFKDLNDSMKEEIITRAEYNLKNSKLDAFPEDYNYMLPYNEPKVDPNDTKNETIIKSAITNSKILKNSKLTTALEKLLGTLIKDHAQDFLELLLNGMKLFFNFNNDYRKNIKDFKGRYLFKSRDNSITVSAVFKKTLIFRRDTMKISSKEISNPDITIMFRDASALKDFLLSKNPDILNAVLSQSITVEGNLNYLYKFGYMAKHLLQMI